MDIRQEIIAHYSLKTVKKIALWAGKNPDHFSVLVKEISKLQDPASSRLAWSLSHIKKTLSTLPEKEIGKLAHLLDHKDLSDGIKRNVLRWFTIHKIPENLEGMLISKGFEYLGNANEAVAIRVHAMEIIYQLSKKFPELSQELSETLQIDFNRQTAGYKSRASKILTKLEGREKKKF